MPLSSFERIPHPATRQLPYRIEVAWNPGPAPDRRLVRKGQHFWQGHDGMRYAASDGAVFDTFEGSRIVISGLAAGAELPLPFYGSVTGVLLAWGGLIPIHGSAVEWNGQALLLCGAAGAGKSTVASALLSRGGRLLSDDLSVLHSPRPGAPLELYLGRTFVRLYPMLAKALSEHVPFSDEPRPAPGNKLSVTPPRADVNTALPLTGLILLGEQEYPASPSEILCAQLFRPHAMRAIPGQRWRLSTLTFAAPALKIMRLETGPIRTQEDFERVADQAVTAVTKAGL